MTIRAPILMCLRAAPHTPDMLFSASTSTTCRRSMIAVTYDWRAASARAEKNGRPEWAYGLQTGWFMTNPGQRLFTSTVGTEGHC